MRILLIEDDEPVIRAMKLRLTKAGHIVIVAQTKQQARDLFRTESPFDLMMVDGWLKGETSDTCDLITRIRTDFAGAMIAMSSCEDTQTQQILAGCDIIVPDKAGAVRFILELSSSHRIPSQGLST